MKALYDSGLHHPLAAYLAAALLCALIYRQAPSLSTLARGRPFLLAFLAVFGLEIALDATVTGAWSPIPPASALHTPLSIVFVVLGDLRYFLLAERYTRPDRSFAHALTVALPLGLFVPIATGLASKVVPIMGNPRVLFLVYEITLLGLVAALQLGVLARRTPAHPSNATFVRRLSAFVMVQYAGWALADVVILAGAEVGYLLRIVPNVLYYAGFLLYVFFVAPERELSAPVDLDPRASGERVGEVSSTARALGSARVTRRTEARAGGDGRGAIISKQHPPDGRKGVER